MRAWLVILLLCALPALAWNTPTHLLAASIAYSTLLELQPASAAKVVALLKAHPEYPHWAKYDLPDVPATEQDRYLVMLASRWADEIKYDNALKRKYAAYNHPEWHYINYPYTPGQAPTWKAPTPNVLTGMAAEMKVLASTQPAARRAIALCWVLHLVADAHCPLHAVSLINDTYPAPDGDRGGNSLYVKTKAENRTSMKLHSLWDGLVLGSDRYKTVRDRATLLRNAYPLSSLPQAKETRLEWILKNEVYPAAVQHVYLNGTLQGSPDKDNAPALPDGYLANAKTVAEQQVALAGYRLAGIIGTVLK
jgi:hypothetical protein